MNVEGTRIVMAAAVKVGVKKVVYCSTQGVHGHITSPPGDENSHVAPADYYQQTKYEGEEVVREYIMDGFNATIIRPTAIYGPGDPERFYMIFNRVQQGVFPMFGSGKTFYHPLYIDNLIDAFVLLLDLEKGRGETYIIADEEYVSLKDLVNRVARAMNKEVKLIYLPFWPMYMASVVCEKLCKPFGIPPPLFPRRADWYRQIRAFRIDKAKRELNFEPKVSLDEGLSRTGQWYITQGLLT